MRWIDEPPCTRLELVEARDGRLELKGPTTGTRVMGGLTAGFGTMFGAFAAPFLRLPFPAPFKLIPLAFVAVGSGLGALGAATATSSVQVIAERRRGLTFRWRVLPMKEKTLRIPSDEIDAFEVSTHQTTHSGDDALGSTTVTTGRVNVGTRAGKALAIEE